MKASGIVVLDMSLFDYEGTKRLLKKSKTFGKIKFFSDCLQLSNSCSTFRS